MQMLPDAGLDPVALTAGPATRKRKQKASAGRHSTSQAALPPQPPPQDALQPQPQSDTVDNVHVPMSEEAPASRSRLRRRPPPPPVLPGIAEIPAAAPPEPKPEPAASSGQCVKQDKTFRWGPSLITFKPPRTYQATCCRVSSHKHELGHNTRCTRTRTFHNDEGEQRVIRELKQWLNDAFKHDTRPSAYGCSC